MPSKFLLEHGHQAGVTEKNPGGLSESLGPDLTVGGWLAFFVSKVGDTGEGRSCHFESQVGKQLKVKVFPCGLDQPNACSDS